MVIKKELEYIDRLKKGDTATLSINLNRSVNTYCYDYSNVEINYRNKEDSRRLKEIYTDGSRIDNKVDSGLVVYDDMEEVCTKGYKLNDDATVFMAELYAIDKAISYVNINKIQLMVMISTLLSQIIFLHCRLLPSCMKEGTIQ